MSERRVHAIAHPLHQFLCGCVYVCVCIVRWNVVLRFLALAPCRCYSLSPRSGRRFLPWILFAFRTSSTLFPFLLIPQLQTRLQSYPSCYLPLSCVGCLYRVSIFLFPSLSFYLFLYRQPSSVPFLPSGLNCCNLWPILVDLTVELSHGDLYGLLILHRCRGWNLAMGFHRFSTTTGWLYARERIGISSGRDARFHHVNQFSDRAIADSFRPMFFYPAASVNATEYL